MPDDLPDGLPLAHIQVEGCKVGPRWDCVVGAKIDGDTMWARIRLREDFRTDMESFGLHTATFDRALNDPSKK